MILSTLLKPPRLTKSFLRVWQRNFLIYKKTWIISLLWTCLEPVLFLGGIGFGLGAYVQQINGAPYVEFLLPGLLVSTAMMVSFFEGTYGHFTKLTWQKTYSTIILTPVSPEDVIFGEMFWTAFKGFMGCVGVILIALILGLIKSWSIFPTLIVLFLMAWLFSCLGMIVSSYVKNYDSFVFFISGIIMPMNFLSGIYFPLEQMPKALQYFAWPLPLAQAVSAARTMMNDQQFLVPSLQCLFLFVLSWFAMNFAIYRVRGKLVK